MVPAPGLHPVAQSAVVNPQLAGDLGYRLPGLQNHLDGLSLELRAEPSALLGHGAILSGRRPCPRSLVHPTPSPESAWAAWACPSPTPAPAPTTRSPSAPSTARSSSASPC